MWSKKLSARVSLTIFVFVKYTGITPGNADVRDVKVLAGIPFEGQPFCGVRLTSWEVQSC
jgi:hypothetical protein